jgi:anti-sigma factor ChrR (cupin superfamily)
LSSAYQGVDLDMLIKNGEWQGLGPGVEVQYLHRAPGEPIAALLRYQPEACVPAHRHLGLEFIHVLSGSQRDAHGVYKAGSFKINLPGTVHDLISDDGCVVLIIWETPVEFLSNN